MLTLTLDTTQKDFEQWWNVQGEWVEEPNERRGGTSGVLRVVNSEGQLLYVKRQDEHIYRSLSYPLGRATILREYTAYCNLLKANVRTPELVYCGVSGKKAILVTKALENFIDLDSWLLDSRKKKLPLAATHAVLDSIAKMFAQLHKNNLQHNCCYAKHIYVKLTYQGDQPLAETALLDLEKCRKRLTAKAAALHDIPQIRRHSVLSASEWVYFVKKYEAAFGRLLPKLTLKA